MTPMGATAGLNAASEALEILERHEQAMVAFDADTSPTIRPSSGTRAAQVAASQTERPFRPRRRTDPRSDRPTRSTAIHDQILIERNLSDEH